MRYMSSLDAYMIYVDGGRDNIAIILHDTRMCRELEWYHSHGLCMCLIDFTLGCPMLYAYLIIMLYIIYTECCMHDETLFFLFGTDHTKTCIKWLLIELYTLCSSLHFSDENLLKLDTYKFWRTINKAYSPCCLFLFASFWINYWHVAIFLGIYKF